MRLPVLTSSNLDGGVGTAVGVRQLVERHALMIDQDERCLTHPMPFPVKRLITVSAICLMMSGIMASSLPAAPQETLSSLAQVHGRLRKNDTTDYLVDLKARVNYWDRGWQSLFVQDGDQAVFVQLENDNYSKVPDFDLGDELHIQGTFNPRRYVINAKSVRRVAVGDPVPAFDLDVQTAAPGSHWSRRVQVSGTVESTLQSFGQLQMVMRHGDRRFFVRARNFDESQLPQVDSQLRVTGTLAYFTNEEDIGDVVMIHQMPGDRLELVQRSAHLTNPQTVPDYDDLKSSRGGLEKGQVQETSVRYEVHGQVAYLHGYEFVVLENEQRQSLLIYAPFQDDLHVGDVVRMTGVRADHCLVKGEPLRSGADSLGRQTHLIAQHVLVVTTAPLPPAPEYRPAEIVQQQSNRIRAVVRGQFQSVSQQEDYWEVVLGHGSAKVVCRIPKSEFSPQKINLDRAEEIEATGIVFPPEGNEDRFRLIVAVMSDIRVTREAPGIDYKVAGFVLGAIVFCILLGICWARIRSRRRERALARLAARLEKTHEAVSEGLLITDARGILVEMNPRLRVLLGVTATELVDTKRSEEAIGVLLRNRFQEDTFQAFWDHAHQQARVIEQREFSTRDVPARTVIVNTTPVFDTYGQIDARVWAFNDVTSERQLEANLLHAQKMDAVGQMVGGVAHDFNNMLAAISANLELLSFETSTTAVERRRFLQDASTACSLAADLARNLLSFSRKSSLELRKTDVSDVVQQMCNLLSRSLHSRVRLDVELSTDLRPCLLDRNYLIQALLNICLNSRDALADDGGTILISTANASADDLTESTPLIHADVNPCDYIRIRIQDDGDGVPVELQEQIFEPFFTTKPEGSGTGIGLATARKLVRQHGGDVLYCSSLQGACFDVLLPVMNPDSEDYEITTQETLVSRHA